MSFVPHLNDPLWKIRSIASNNFACLQLTNQIQQKVPTKSWGDRAIFLKLFWGILTYIFDTRWYTYIHIWYVLKSNCVPVRIVKASLTIFGVNTLQIILTNQIIMKKQTPVFQRCVLDVFAVTLKKIISVKWIPEKIKGYKKYFCVYNKDNERLQYQCTTVVRLRLPFRKSMSKS